MQQKRELKKLSLSSINPKDKQGKSEDNSVSNADKLLDLQLKISEDLEKYKAFFENRKGVQRHEGGKNQRHAPVGSEKAELFRSYL